MGDAISLGVAAFEGKQCLVGKPPGCILDGGRIEYDSQGEAMCPQCGMQAGLISFDTQPKFDEEGQIAVPFGETGAKRGRKEARGKLFGDSEWNAIAQQWVRTHPGFVNEYNMSANAQGEVRRVYSEMLDRGYHLGGTGLDALVHAAAWFGTRFDYNFVPMKKIAGDLTAQKKANRVVKRAQKDGLVPRVIPDPTSILESVLVREPASAAVSDLSRKYAAIQIPGLRPNIHAAGALYLAMRTGGNSAEKKATQAKVGERFHIGRKYVGQGYRALNDKISPKPNPPPSVAGLTSSQVRLLRRLR